jgi:hypothetical protein
MLTEIRDTRPGSLQGYPGPDIPDVPPPWSVSLAASQAELAAILYGRFGSDLHLRVGALPYPMPAADPHAGVQLPPSLDFLDPDQVRAELDGPATVACGHTTHHCLVLTNLTTKNLTVLTNGQVTAVIVDLDAGTPIGGFAGAQRMPLIRFSAGPRESVRIPVVIGTASFTPELGYVVPPGQWGLRVKLHLHIGDGESTRRTTETLPLTVSA